MSLVDPTRHAFILSVGHGFASLALGAMLARDGIGRAGEPPAGPLSSGAVAHAGPHFAPKARSVIWLFMVGGVSRVESFDPKPALNQFAGKTIAETPHKDVLTATFLKDNVRVAVPNDANGRIRSEIYPLQVGYRKWGHSGLEISDWCPQVASCADDLAIVRSLWTTDNNHGAQLQFHPGRHPLDGHFPTIGSWCHYGLGSLSEDLPQFLVMGRPIADGCGGAAAHGGSYLGPEHDGVQLAVDPKSPLPFNPPGRDHHPFGFCAWLAGGGTQGGIAHGATDELGFHAVEDRHYITDIHAIVLHLLG